MTPCSSRGRLLSRLRPGRTRGAPGRVRSKLRRFEEKPCCRRCRPPPAAPPRGATRPRMPLRVPSRRDAIITGGLRRLGFGSLSSRGQWPHRLCSGCCGQGNGPCSGGTSCPCSTAPRWSPAGGIALRLKTCFVTAPPACGGRSGFGSVVCHAAGGGRGQGARAGAPVAGSACVGRGPARRALCTERTHMRNGSSPGQMPQTLPGSRAAIRAQKPASAWLSHI